MSWVRRRTHGSGLWGSETMGALPGMQGTGAAVTQQTIPGDWMTLAGALGGLLSYARNRDRTKPSHSGGPDQDGYKFTVYDGHSVGRVIADVWLANAVEGCIVTTIGPGADELIDVIDQVAHIAVYIDGIRQMAAPESDVVLSRYYHMRAQGNRVTLKQLAEESGIPYSTLTKRKMVYDRLGGYGTGKRRKALKEE